ncbi:MAG TPA: hypothetical protein VMH90_03760, partial [Thermoplasmata archaeon]|nr:hypothetical protein [Thermoplasmata archaeon]
MSPPTCGEVRTYLASLERAEGPAAPAPGVWDALAGHGAVSGTPSAPTLTPVGRHVLGELNVRAYRTDPLPLDRVAEDLTRVIQEFDDVAKTAEYFLADLGPVVPPVALPLLRPVAVGLANRRETPEDLAREFQRVWGGVEVMGGDPRDRLLAAELLNAASANMEMVYSPIMNSAEAIREKLGGGVSSVAPATLLQLSNGGDRAVDLSSYYGLRAAAGSDEAAALLAAAGPDPAAAVARRDRFVAALAPTGGRTPDALHAATYLVATAAEPAEAERVKALAAVLAPRLDEALTSAALLAGHGKIAPEEVANWLDKAIDVLTRRTMAPTKREIAALAVALVFGLPESEYLQPGTMDR